MATIHISRAGVTVGTFSEDEVRERLRTGRLSHTDAGWREGMTAWQPLSAFPEFARDIATPPSPATAQSGQTVRSTHISGFSSVLAGWFIAFAVLNFLAAGLGGVLLLSSNANDNHLGSILLPYGVTGAFIALAMAKIISCLHESVHRLRNIEKLLEQRAKFG
jgi:hypothetical protein